MTINWFSEKDIKILPAIKVYNLHGLVLPHAGISFWRYNKSYNTV